MIHDTNKMKGRLLDFYWPKAYTAIKIKFVLKKIRLNEGTGKTEANN